MNDQTKLATPDGDDRPSDADAAAVFNLAAGQKELPRQLRDWTPPSVEDLSDSLPDFEVVSLLGRGAMGAVYRARQRSLDRDIAIKILPQELAEDPAFEERFHREAKAMAELSHPNIVQVFDFGHTKAGHAYYVMELVDGTDLRHLIQSGHLSEEQVLAVVTQICTALQYAHGCGYVHRDVKPANVFLSKDGTVKIGDFGLAKVVGPSAVAEFGLTRTGVAMGTPGYSAPEQMSRPEQVDHRADIFSLGVLFYEMLTGEVPAGHFPPPSQRVEVDVRLDEVVLRALNADPNLRYQQASEVGAAVTTIREQPAPAAAPVSAATIAPAAPPPMSAAPTASPRKGMGIGCLILFLVGLFLVVPIVLLLLFGMFYFKRASPVLMPSSSPSIQVFPLPNAPGSSSSVPPEIEAEIGPDHPFFEGTHATPANSLFNSLADRAALIVATKAAEPETWIEADELFDLLRIKSAGGVNDAREKLEAFRFDRLGINFGPGHFHHYAFENLLESQDPDGDGPALGLFRDVTIRGAGVDKTMLKMRAISPHYSIERLHIQDMTLDCNGGGIVDLRGKDRELRVYAHNVRFIGFDAGNGGSYITMSEGPTAFIAERCSFHCGFSAQTADTRMHRYLLDISPELQPKRRHPYPLVACFQHCQFTDFSAPRNVTPHAWRMPPPSRARVEFTHCQTDGQPWYMNDAGQRSQKFITFSDSEVIPDLAPDPAVEASIRALRKLAEDPAK